MHTHIVHYRGTATPCTPETYDEVCAGLFASHGLPNPTDFPRIEEVNPEQVKVPRVPTAPVASPESRKERILADEVAAREGGFAPKPPIYEVGTPVNETGVENAKRSLLEHEQKPLAIEVAKGLVQTVRNERREDLLPIEVSALRMSTKGRLVFPDKTAMPYSDRTFASLMGRMSCRSGVGYLSDCTPELRAINFNHWATRLGESGQESRAVVRTRVVEGQRQAFAAVSPSYTSFDCDVIGEALTLAFPKDARGSLQYDGQRMRLEGLWHTNVAAEDFAAGEFFKAGIVVRADDTGGGSIRVSSVLWRNLCLNLIILDKSVGVDVRIRHMGSVEKLAEQFREAFAASLKSVAGFRKAWGSAMEERDDVLLERIRRAHDDEHFTGMKASDLLPGLFSGILEGDLVKVPGRKKDLVPKLLTMHAEDEAASTYGVSRASIVNAFTRYASRIETDPFAADEIREGAGELLSSRKVMPFDAAFAA